MIFFLFMRKFKPISGNLCLFQILDLRYLIFSLLNDYLLFAKATASQVCLVNQVLDTFCKVVGFKVNLQKYRFLASKNMLKDKTESFKSILEFGRTYHIDKYLGWPILTKRFKNRDFDFILDKIQRRLTGWKSKLFRRASKVNLAKSILEAIPSYTIQNVWIPEGFYERINAYIRFFVWGKPYTH